MDTLTELSLFSGYGGFSLGLRLAGVRVQTACYVENDAYCQRLIAQRIDDGFLDDAPLWDDVKTFDGQPWRGCVDLVTAGFPCQPHSVAGQRRGEADERNLWPDTLRVIREVGPRFVLLENVPGILANGYGGTVVGQLSEAGYDCIWDCIPAAAVGAPHLRWRWWCLAYLPDTRCRGIDSIKQVSESWRCGSSIAGADGQDGDVADAEDAGRATRPSQGQPRGRGAVGNATCQHESRGRVARTANDPIEYWEVEPDVGRVADGVAHRVDRLRALGNGIVPAVVAKFLGGQ